ncbi:MAG TPA: hypothetical protein VGD46_15835 [Rhizobacter sp.]
MAAYDYIGERQSAHNDIVDNGAAVVLSVTGPDVQDGGSGEVTPGPTISVNTYGLVSQFKNSEIDGSAILRGDFRLTASALDLANRNVEPGPGWKCLLGGKTYRVMDAQPVAPGGIPVLWKLQLRK